MLWLQDHARNLRWWFHSGASCSQRGLASWVFRVCTMLCCSAYSMFVSGCTVMMMMAMMTTTTTTMMMMMMMMIWWCYFYFMFACDELFYFVLTCSCIIAWHCLVSLISPRWGAVVLPPGPAPTGLLTHQSYYIIMITSHKGVMIYHVEPVERGGERLLSGFWGFNLWQIMSMCCTAVFRNHIVVSCSFCRENIAYWRIFFIPVLIHLWSAVLISTGNIPLKSCINLNRITIFLFQGNIQTKKVKYCEQVQH